MPGAIKRQLLHPTLVRCCAIDAPHLDKDELLAGRQAVVEVDEELFGRHVAAKGMPEATGVKVKLCRQVRGELSISEPVHVCIQCLVADCA